MKQKQHGSYLMANAYRMLLKSIKPHLEKIIPVEFSNGLTDDVSFTKMSHMKFTKTGVVHHIFYTCKYLEAPFAW